MTIHATAIISENTIIGTGVTIGPYAVIGDAIIGNDSIIHPFVVIADGVVLGRAVEIFPGAMIGKEPKGAGALARKPEFIKRILIGDECSIGPHAVIFYDVEIGNNTLLGDGASVREKCKIGSKCIISRYVTINYNTCIGNHTKIMDTTHITGNTTIGDHVFISTMVATTNDNFINAGYGDHIKGPVINDGAMIGAGVSVLPNLQIGKHSIVGSGSVVTKDVAPHTVTFGNPAKMVRVITHD